MHGADGDNEALPDTTNLAGRVIAGKYQLTRLLGQGGMGAVYEARHLTTLKRCAVKLLLSPELAQHAGMVKRFFREAKASSVVESDHIVQIFDSGSDPEFGAPYMVMELLSGEDLEALVRRVGPLPPASVAKITLQAALGLSKAHELGIVHRDIKAANLFLTRRDSGDYLIKVLDFGIAKVKMEQLRESAHGLTRTGSLLGTPLYMSPEQAQGAPDIDARSDVWSLGVVMFELLCGETPFAHSRSLGELMVNIITNDVPLIQDRAPWVPPELADVVHRAMSRDLAFRFRDAGELASALARIAGDGPRLGAEAIAPLPEDQRAHVAPRVVLADSGMLHATAPAALSVSRAEPPKRRSAPRVAAALASLAAVVGLGAFAWSRHRATPAVLATTAPATAAAPSREPAESASAPAPIETHALDVGPDGVRVTVDGRPVAVVDGHVGLSGTPGEVHHVRLELGKESVEEEVALTTAGPMPKRVELAKKPNARAGAAETPAKPKATASEAKPAEPAPATKATSTTPEVTRDLKEFGN